MNERPTRDGQGAGQEGSTEASYGPRPPAARPEAALGDRLQELGRSVPLVNRVLLLSGAVAVLLGLAGMILGRILAAPMAAP